MKKLILIIAVVILYSNMGQAQEYRPLAGFCKDTLAYLKTNFIDNKSRYIGQKLEKLILDYEILLANTPPMGTNEGGGGVDPSYICGITLFYLHSIKMDQYRDAQKPFYRLRIYFAPPYCQEENPIARKMIEMRNRKNAILYYLKDYIIEKIVLVKVKGREVTLFE